MKRKNSPINDFLSLSEAEKEKVSLEFDREFIGDTFGPLSPAHRRQWQRIKKSLGRPVKGKGHKVISVSIERGLLAKADALAKRRKITRASLIAQALETVLSKAS